jgi:hypothetical protein
MSRLHVVPEIISDLPFTDEGLISIMLIQHPWDIKFSQVICFPIQRRTERPCSVETQNSHTSITTFLLTIGSPADFLEVLNQM